MKSFNKKVFITLMCTATLVVAGATPALAATNYSVAGDFNCTGSLVQYGTYRSHVAGDSAKLTVNHMWWVGSQEGRWGLRNTSNTQVTNSLSFFATGTPGTKSFANTAGGSAIPGTSLGVNARLVGTNDCVPLPTWDGTLTQ
jgi:hypothetical protein